jgi:hypothetical protein
MQRSSKKIKDQRRVEPTRSTPYSQPGAPKLPLEQRGSGGSSVNLRVTEACVSAPLQPERCSWADQRARQPLANDKSNGRASGGCGAQQVGKPPVGALSACLSSRNLFLGLYRVEGSMFSTWSRRVWVCGRCLKQGSRTVKEEYVHIMRIRGATLRASELNAGPADKGRREKGESSQSDVIAASQICGVPEELSESRAFKRP